MPGGLHMVPDAAVETDRIITITDRAHEQILTLRAAEDDGDGLGPRVEVTRRAGRRLHLRPGLRAAGRR